MVSNKALAKSWLEDVLPGEVFRCHDGRVVKNLDELATSLREMSPQTYHYHVSRGRNDFSLWVTDVIGDVALSRELEKATTSTTAASMVDTRVSRLRKGT